MHVDTIQSTDLDYTSYMSKLQNTSISLVKEYAKLELYYPTINHSKITLARVLSILMSLTESKFESISVMLLPTHSSLTRTNRLQFQERETVDGPALPSHS